MTEPWPTWIEQHEPHEVDVVLAKEACQFHRRQDLFEIFLSCHPGLSIRPRRCKAHLLQHMTKNRLQLKRKQWGRRHIVAREIPAKCVPQKTKVVVLKEIRTAQHLHNPIK